MTLNRLRHFSNGFSLIEVMVAVFVLAFGLMGVGTLQVTSKRANLEATQRATAAALGQDLVERMRANPTQLSVYTNGGVGRTLDGTTMPTTDCSAACTSEQLANHDLFEFEQSLFGVAERQGGTAAGGLAVPTACITGPNGGSGTYTIAIAWRGLTRLTNPTLNSCAGGLGRYDALVGGVVEADAFRRLFVLATFISDPI